MAFLERQQMKFKGTIIGEASGSLASLVFSHNRGGQYIRQRTIPTNPNSAYQQAIRSIVASLTSYWRNNLSEAERFAWDTYAENVPLLDPLGEPRNIGGLGHFNRSNVARLNTTQPDLAQVDAAPTIFNLGDFTVPGGLTISSGAGTASMPFTNTDDWAGEVGGACIGFGSRAQNASINFYKGPYRYMGVILGAVVPPASPKVWTMPFPVAVGQKFFMRCVFVRADGRVSSTFRTGGVAGV